MSRKSKNPQTQQQGNPMSIVKSGGEAATETAAPAQELEQETSTQEQGQPEQGQASESDNEPQQEAGGEPAAEEAGRGQTTTTAALDEAAEQITQEPAVPSEEPLGENGTPAIQVLAQQDPVLTGEQQFRDVLALFPEQTQRYIVAFLTSDELISREAMENILAYVRSMSPTTPNTPETGGQWQSTLYRSVMEVINRGCADWNTFYGVFLQIVYCLKDNHVFKPTMINRFLEEAPLTLAERRAFTRMMHVFVTTSDASNRSFSARQINLDAAMQECVTEAGRQRIKAYYS